MAFHTDYSPQVIELLEALLGGPKWDDPPLPEVLRPWPKNVRWPYSKKRFATPEPPWPMNWEDWLAVCLEDRLVTKQFIAGGLLDPGYVYLEVTRLGRSVMREYRRKQAELVDCNADSLAMDPDAFAILSILKTAYPKTMSFDAIWRESVRLNRADPKTMRRLNSYIVRTRVTTLIQRKFVERPVFTKKQGVAITSIGLAALEVCASKLDANSKDK